MDHYGTGPILQFFGSQDWKYSRLAESVGLVDQIDHVLNTAQKEKLERGLD